MEEELTPAEIVIKFIRIYSIQAIISLSLFSLSFFLLTNVLFIYYYGLIPALSTITGISFSILP
ncbi:hypothetical protein D6D85_08825 [Candidatus Methanodesulfokora washburnensis]|jgi:hypothetical protein|uniref:Uncharacterized protein n=1 Tax=Candidatus Methanodesulfokora washburnensis TaxID=2478471 RepID=A0A3R9RMV9_9CREN|nr:hypothetical protein D6D85_08825 [Candidatus Methanodesulfokores washburnensis]